MREIRWGIIGCGNVTEVKSGPGFQKAEGSSLVAVMRRNGKLAEDYAIRHSVPKWYDNADSLIHDPEIDAVYIATPPSSHKQYTIAVAKAGKPVYVEKPMAVGYDECRKMIQVCEEKNVPLFVAYYRRTLQRFLKIKELLENNAIGAVRSVIISFYKKPVENDFHNRDNWRVDPQVAGCGYFCDLASHQFDILQFFFGPIKSASGFSSNQMGVYKAEDIVSGCFIFESGIHGAGLWCFSAYSELDRTEIIGENGKITFSTFDTEPIVFQTNNKVENYLMDNPAHVQQPLIQTIVNELLGFGKCPSTGRTASLTNRVMDLMLGRY
jgi:predicted dehydrogenase